MNTMSNEKEQTRTDYDEEIERMAEERIQIEEDLEARTGTLSKLGDFDTARCTDFEYKRKNGRKENRWIAFRFQTPSGDEVTKGFYLYREPKDVERFLEDHGADSVTGMVGKEHTCVYTDHGWKLTENASASSWKFLSRPSQRGDIHWIYLPAALVGVLSLVVPILLLDAGFLTVGLVLAGISFALATTVRPYY